MEVAESMDNGGPVGLSYPVVRTGAGGLSEGVAASGSEVVLCGLVLLRNDDGGCLSGRCPEVGTADDLSGRVGDVYICVGSLVTAVGYPCLSVAVAGSHLEGHRRRGCAGHTVKVGHVPVGIPEAVEDGLAGRRV